MAKGKLPLGNSLLACNPIATGLKTSSIDNIYASSHSTKSLLSCSIYNIILLSLNSSPRPQLNLFFILAICLGTSALHHNKNKYHVTGRTFSHALKTSVRLVRFIATSYKICSLVILNKNLETYHFVKNSFNYKKIHTYCT